MANNTYTLNDLQKAVIHCLGGTPDQNLNPQDIVNGALSDLCHEEPWKFRQAALSIGSTSSQSFINLPSDFEELLTVKKVGDTTASIEAATLDQIYLARQTTPTLTASLLYCVNWKAQGSTTAEPTAFLELYPTPASTTNPYLAGVYLRQIPRLSATTDVPDIPSTFHQALWWGCRAYAAAAETGQFGADWTMYQKLLADLKRLDGRQNGYIGRMRGGLAERTYGPTVGPVTTSP